MIGTILAVAGLIATFIFGLYSILINRKNQKNVSLSFEKKECYSLFKKDINRLNIDINYKGKIVDSYLILFKGLILNNGNLDIDKNRIYKPILIKTKNEFKWLEINVTNSPNGANVTLEKTEKANVLEINWDLLKKNEEIEFEALIEIPQDIEIDEISDEFYNSINFDFRITDLNKIEKIIDLNSKEKKLQKSNFKLKAIGISALIFGIIILFSQEISKFIPFFQLNHPEIEYNIALKSDTLMANIKAKNLKTIIVENNSWEKEFKINDFNKDLNIIKINKIAYTKPDWYLRIMGIVYIITSFFAFWLVYKRNKKLQDYKKQPPTTAISNAGESDKIENNE